MGWRAFEHAADILLDGGNTLKHLFLIVGSFINYYRKAINKLNAICCYS
jgi:hypothetical protein